MSGAARAARKLPRRKELTTGRPPRRIAAHGVRRVTSKRVLRGQNQRMVLPSIQRSPDRITPPERMNLGILASHDGTTLQSVIDACADGRVPGRVVVVVSNNSTSGALVRARQAGIRAVHLSSKTHDHLATLDAAIRDTLLAAEVDLIFLAGYMKRLGPLVLAAFPGRILNTHSALLPKFAGHGMYGDRVFEAVLEAGEPESGVSIHLVDSEYDTGLVVRQCRVPVLSGDSIDDLKTRVRAREKKLVVDTFAAIAHGRIRLAERAGQHRLAADAARCLVERRG